MRGPGEDVIRIVLDSSVVIRAPDLLSRKLPDVDLALPLTAYAELVSTGYVRGYRYEKLVDEAVNAGLLELVPLDADTRRSPGYSKLGRAEAEILAVALAAKARFPGDEVLLATEDLDLRHAGRLAGLSAIDAEELRNLFAPAASNAAVERRAERVIRYERKQLVFGVALGAAATATVWIFYRHASLFLRTVPVWGTLAATLVLAVLLFWARSRQRIAYGLGEVGAGFVTVVNVFYPGFDYSELRAVSLLQILGGLYVMVRGLDNVGKGLRGTRYGQRWERWFPN